MSEIKLDANYFKSLRRAAEEGDVNSKKRLKQAAKNGDIEAMYEYGNLMTHNNNYDELQKAEKYYGMAANKGHRKSMEKLIDVHLKINEFIGYTININSLTKTFMLCEKYEDSYLRDKIINFYDKIGKIYPKAKKRYEEITTGISTNKQEIKTTETTPNIQKPKQIPSEVFKKSDFFINKQKEEEPENEYSEIKKLADKGDGKAILEYFYLIYNNEIDANEEEKTKYYKMAANIGEHHAANEYLKLILDNKVDINEEKLEYIKMMAEKGNVRAAYEYGCILRDGLYDVIVNKKEANKFFKFAADIGIADIDGKFAYNYANILYKDNKIEEALKYFKRAADRGNENALEEYNSISDKKRVIECFKIMPKGVEEIEYFANEGNIEAMYELGNYYRFIENKEKANECYKMAAEKGHKKAVIKFKNDSLSEKINRFEEIRDNLIKYSCNITLYNSTRENPLRLFNEYMNFLKCNPELGKFDFTSGENPDLEQLINEDAKRITGDDEYNKIYSVAKDRSSSNATMFNTIYYANIVRVECYKNLIDRIFYEITENIESYKDLDEATIIGKATEKIKNELAEENRREKTDEEKIELLEKRNKFLTVVLKKSLNNKTITVLNEKQLKLIKESENKEFKKERCKVEKKLNKKGEMTDLIKNMCKHAEDATMLAIIANEKEIEQLKEKLKNKNKPVTERVEKLKREARSTKQEHTTNRTTQKKNESKIFKRIIIDFGNKTQDKEESITRSNSPV